MAWSIEAVGAFGIVNFRCAPQDAPLSLFHTRKRLFTPTPVTPGGATVTLSRTPD